jgi:transcription elongation GreA/GreB family factor
MIKDNHIKTSALPLLYQEASTELEALADLNVTIDNEIRSKRNGVVENAVINVDSVILQHDPKSQLEVLQELVRQGYAKVVVLHDDDGRVTRYRVTQANKSVIKGKDGGMLNLIGRLAPLARHLITAELDDEIECNGKFFGYVKLIEYVKKSSFRENDFSSFELIENDADYDLRRKKLVNVISALKLPTKFESDEPGVAAVAERPATSVINSEKKASLSAEFYTRTTPEQEELIRFPNSAVLLWGVRVQVKHLLRSAALRKYETLHILILMMKVTTISLKKLIGWSALCCISNWCHI